MPTVHLSISGKVQGVFYRATARDVAERLGLTGWVRNTREGGVEARVSGSSQQIEAFVDWCRKGPPKAVVTKVSVEPVPDELFTEFKVIRG